MTKKTKQAKSNSISISRGKRSVTYRANCVEAVELLFKALLGSDADPLKESTDENVDQDSSHAQAN